MNPIIDTIVIIIFILILAFLIIGFNREMMQNHLKRLEEQKKSKEENKKE